MVKTTEQTASDTWDCEDLETEEPAEEEYTVHRDSGTGLGYEIGLLDSVSDTELNTVA